MQSRYRDIQKRRTSVIVPLVGLALAAVAAAAWWRQQRRLTNGNRLPDYTAGAELGAMVHPMTTPVAGADEMLTREMAGS